MKPMICMVLASLLSVSAFATVHLPALQGKLEVKGTERTSLVKILKTAQFSTEVGAYTSIQVICDSGFSLPFDKCDLFQDKVDKSATIKLTAEVKLLRKLVANLRKQEGYASFDTARIMIDSCSAKSCVVSIQPDGGAASL